MEETTAIEVKDLVISYRDLKNLHQAEFSQASPPQGREFCGRQGNLLHRTKGRDPWHYRQKRKRKIHHAKRHRGYLFPGFRLH